MRTANRLRTTLGLALAGVTVAVLTSACSIQDAVCGNDEYPVLAVGSAGSACVPDGEEPPPEGTVEEQIQALLDEAALHFAAADEALRAGDLATYQTEIAAAEASTTEAQQLIAELLGVEAAPTASPTPEPSPSG